MNAPALADIQASLCGFFSVGGSLTNLASSGNDYLFGFSVAQSNQLNIYCTPSKAQVLEGSGVPGKGIPSSSGFRRPTTPA